MFTAGLAHCEDCRRLCKKAGAPAGRAAGAGGRPCGEGGLEHDDLLGAGYSAVLLPTSLRVRAVTPALGPSRCDGLGGRYPCPRGLVRLACRRFMESPGKERPMRRGAKPAKAKVEAKLPVARKSRTNEGSRVPDLKK